VPIIKTKLNIGYYSDYDFRSIARLPVKQAFFRAAILPDDIHQSNR